MGEGEATLQLSWTSVGRGISLGRQSGDMVFKSYGDFAEWVDFAYW